MAAVRGAELNVRCVPGDAPLVAGAQAELNRRRIGARGADRAVGVRDRRAVRAAGVADLRDRLAEVHAGRILVDQRRRIRLPALVPGCRPLQGESGHHAGHERSLNTLDEEVLAVSVEEDVAGHARVEESDLDVVPVLAVHGSVPLQATIEEFRLPADLVVGQLVGRVRPGNRVLRYSIWPRGVDEEAAVLVEAARAEALRERVIHHYVRCDVPGQIPAALVAGFGVLEILRVEVEGGSGPASTGRDASLEATETGQDAASQGVLEAEMPCTERHRQHLRNQIEVDGGEESRLLRFAHLVLVERGVVALYPGIPHRRAKPRGTKRQHLFLPGPGATSS